jgi:L-rhamnose isomerase
VRGRAENLRPWKPGQSGNAGGRPKKRSISEELERMLDEEAPNSGGKPWAAVIAEALLRKARRGDVRAISELANRIEGKPHQSLDVYGNIGLAERIAEARKRAALICR